MRVPTTGVPLGQTQAGGEKYTDQGAISTNAENSNPRRIFVVPSAIVMFEKRRARGVQFIAVNAGESHVHYPLFFFFSEDGSFGYQSFRMGTHVSTLW
jgi:hypothetical protein